MGRVLSTDRSRVGLSTGSGEPHLLPRPPRLWRAMFPFLTVDLADPLARDPMNASASCLIKGWPSACNARSLQPCFAGKVLQKGRERKHGLPAPGTSMSAVRSGAQRGGQRIFQAGGW